MRRIFIFWFFAASVSLSGYSAYGDCPTTTGTYPQPQYLPLEPINPSPNDTDILFVKQTSKPIQYLSGPAPVAFRACLYNTNLSNGASALVKLSTGATNTFTFDGASCVDFFVSGLTIGPACNDYGTCDLKQVNFICRSTGSVVATYYFFSQGWTERSATPNTDKILNTPAYSYYLTAGISKRVPLFISETSMRVSVCVNRIGANIVYDVNDPFGGSAQIYTTTQLGCTEVAGKYIAVDLDQQATSIEYTVQWNVTQPRKSPLP